jgi:hypothetical protein
MSGAGGRKKEGRGGGFGEECGRSEGVKQVNHVLWFAGCQGVQLVISRAGALAALGGNAVVKVLIPDQG